MHFICAPWLMDLLSHLVGGDKPAETKRGLPFSATTTINLTAVPVVVLLVLGLVFRG